MTPRPRLGFWAASCRAAAWLGVLQAAACTMPGPIRPEAIRVTCPHVPAPPDAKPPKPPVSAFPQTLRPGHWDWSDGQYVWTPATWEARFDSKPAHWVGGRWEVNGGACVWLKGYSAEGDARR